MHWAALHGNRRIVRILIGANADVDAQDNGRWAFVQAFPFGVGGCATAHPDANRWTPLHYTADNGDAETIEELLLSGAVAIQNCVG